MNVLFMQNRERQGISSRIRAASNKVYHFACSSCTSHPPDEQRSVFAMTLRNFPVGNYCYLPRCSLFPRKFTRANFFSFLSIILFSLSLSFSLFLFSLFICTFIDSFIDPYSNSGKRDGRYRDSLIMWEFRIVSMMDIRRNPIKGFH